MLKSLNEKYIIAGLLWLVLLIFRYFGDYSKFILLFSEWVFSLDIINSIIAILSSTFSFSNSNAEWFAARITAVLAILINFFIVKLIFNIKLARVFVITALSSMIVSIIGIYFHSEAIRISMYQITSISTDPILILILIPIFRLYKYFNDETNKI